MKPFHEMMHPVREAFAFALDPNAFRVDPVTSAIVLAVLLLAGYLGSATWPKRARPDSLGGALLGLTLSSAMTGLAVFVTWRILSLGHIACLSSRRRTCGFSHMDGTGHFVDRSEHMISVHGQAPLFWINFAMFAVPVVCAIAWWFVCVRSLRKRERDVALAASRAYHRRPHGFES